MGEKRNRRQTLELRWRLENWLLEFSGEMGGDGNHSCSGSSDGWIKSEAEKVTEDLATSKPVRWKLNFSHFASLEEPEVSLMLLSLSSSTWRHEGAQGGGSSRL